MKSRIAVLTIIYAHVLLIPWGGLFPHFLNRYGPFLLSMLLMININNVRHYITCPKDKILGGMLLLLFASTIITSISVNDINVDSVLLHDPNELHYEL